MPVSAEETNLRATHKSTGGFSSEVSEDEQRKRSEDQKERRIGVRRGQAR